MLRALVDELGRLQRQRGVFTWLDSDRFFELRGFLDDPGRGRLLTCLVLPDSAILDGLRDLDRHGIDFLTLFPDLTGAARHANHLLARERRGHVAGGLSAPVGGGTCAPTRTSTFDAARISS